MTKMKNESQAMIFLAAHLGALNGSKIPFGNDVAALDARLAGVRRQGFSPLEFALECLKRVALNDDVPAESRLDVCDALVAVEAYRLGQEGANR